jgi:integration host factor subunit beta
MLKSEIEEKIAREFKLEKQISKKILNVLIDTLIDSIKNNDRVEIRGFGSFFPKKYDSYKGRNPKTGDSIDVPVKVLPIFRPSKELVVKLNKKKD